MSGIMNVKSLKTRTKVVYKNVSQGFHKVRRLHNNKKKITEPFRAIFKKWPHMIFNNL